MSKEEKTYLLKEDEKQNYSYDEFIKKEFSNQIIESQGSIFNKTSVLVFGAPIYEASLIANSNFEVFQKQIGYDNLNQHKILELQEKLSKIKNNLEINKNKIIKNLKEQKNNKFINFIIKIFSVGKINKNKDIDNKISNVQTKWTEIKRIKKETNFKLKKLLKTILKNQEINNKEILNIKKTNLKLQQENSKFKTDFEQLNKSEQLLKTIILENKVDEARMQKQIEQQKILIVELKQKIKMIKEEQIEQQKTVILEVDEQMVANYETQIFELNKEVINLENNLKSKQAFINELEQKVKDNKMKIKELQEKLDENEQLIIRLEANNEAKDIVIETKEKSAEFWRKELKQLRMENDVDSGVEVISEAESFHCVTNIFNKDLINEQNPKLDNNKSTKSQISL